VIISTPDVANADQQGPARDAGGQQNRDQSASDYNGEDFTRPESKFEARFEGVMSGTTTRTNREVLLLRMDGAISLAADWKFGWLTQIPVVNKDTTAPNPADSTHDFGIGDAAVQGFVYIGFEGATGANGAAGDIDKVIHVFQPLGRFTESNSQYAFKLRHPCMLPTGNKYPSWGPMAATRAPPLRRTDAGGGSAARPSTPVR
jgi:hypothetical protein